MMNADARSSLYCALIRDPIPFDPEAAARDPFYWADHADEDLEATEARRRDEAWAQIKAGDVQ